MAGRDNRGKKDGEKKARSPTRFQKLREIIKGLANRIALQPIRGGAQISRRRLLASLVGVGAGAGVIAGSVVAARRLKARPDEITFAFSRHRTAEDAKHLESVLAAAEKLGTPYDAIGEESNSTKPEELGEWMRISKSISNSYSKVLQHKLEEGKTREQALKELEKEILENVLEAGEQKYPNFAAKLDFIKAKYGLPAVPIEWYSDKEREEMEEHFILAEELGILALRQKKLGEQLETIEHAERERARYTLARNERIAECVQRSLELLRHHYPHLSRKPSIRILYQLGYGHTGLINARLNGKRVETSFSLNLRPDDIYPHFVLRKLSINPRTPLSEEEKARLVLANNLAIRIIEIRGKRPEEVAFLKARVAQATLDEFKELDEATAGERFIKKAVMVSDYFKKKYGFKGE